MGEQQSTSLVRLSQAAQMLASIDRADDALKLADMAEAARVYARKADLGTDAVNYATSIKARALKRMAEIVTEGQASGEIATAGGDPIVRSQDNAPTTLSDLGITRQRLHEARKLETLGEKAIAEAIAEANAEHHEISYAELARRADSNAKKAQQTQREEERARQTVASPTRPAIVVSHYADWLADQEPCDLLLTDPPYSTDVDDVESFAWSWVPKALALVKPTGRAYICIGAYPEELQAYLTIGKNSHGMSLENVLVWTYRNTLGPQPAHNYKLNWQAILYFVGPEAPPLDCPVMLEQFTVQDIPAPDGRQGDRYHTWQKPLALAERFVRHSTAPGQLVYDCFAGTGTHLIAAANLGRIAKGCDRDSAMVDIAVQRGCRHEG